MTEQECSASSSGMRFAKLDGTNYREWVMDMQDFLQREGLWRLTIGKEEILEKPKEESRQDKDYEKRMEKYEAQQQRIEKATGTLRSAMTKGLSVSYYGSGYETPGDIWNDVVASYETITNYDAHHLHNELYNTTLEECGTVRDYLNRLRELRDKLALCEQLPSYAQLIFHLFAGLPKTTEWRTWILVTKASLTSQNTSTGWEKAKTFLTAYEAELQRSKSIHTEQALFTDSRRNNRKPFNNKSHPDRSAQQHRGQNQKPKSFDGKCHNCGKDGHRKAECWQERNGNGGVKEKGQNSGWKAEERDYSGESDDQVLYGEEQMKKEAGQEMINSTQYRRGRKRERDKRRYPVEKAMNAVETADRLKWMLDSGCTNHMTGSRQAFVEGTYVDFPADQRQMKTASGELISVAGIGSVKTHIWTPRGGRENLLLTKVFYVPAVKEMGLISVGQLTERGIKIEYTDDAAEFYKDGTLIALAAKCNRLFKLVQDERHCDFSLLVSGKDNITAGLSHHGQDLGQLQKLEMSNTEVVDRKPCLKANTSESHYSVYLKESLTKSLISKQLIKFTYNLFLLALFLTLGTVMVSTFINCAQRIESTNAINSELQSLEGHDTWFVVSTSNDMNDNLRPISSRMILQEQLDEDGRVSRYKARLIAHGFRQRPGIDFMETYSPTISFPAIRMVLSKAAVEDKEIVQLDIVTAFLESEIEELIYLQLPKEFGVSSEGKVVLEEGYNGDKSGTRTSNVVVQLKKSLYGLKQAGYNWYNTFESHLKDELGMESSKYEAGIYTTESGATIIVWVDDMLLIGTKAEVRWMKSAISKRFKIKDLGNVKFFLSMLVERDRDKRTIYLSQDAYITSVLKRFQMENCKGCPTPMDPKCKLHNRLEEEEAASKTQYQEAVGCLTYAAITTRPDIAYASGMVGRFSSNPSTAHWTAVKRILRYLRHTQHLRLRLGRRADWAIGGVSRLSGNAPIAVYADADFAGEVDGMRSTSGFIILDQYGAIVHWKSQRQKTVAKSTADAEFNSTALAVEEALWLQKLQGELYGYKCESECESERESEYMSEIRGEQEETPLISVFNDNQACIASLKNGQFKPSTRHVGVKNFWLRELVRDGDVEISYVRTDEMVADGLTKALERGKHQGFINMLSFST